MPHTTSQVTSRSDLITSFKETDVKPSHLVRAFKTAYERMARPNTEAFLDKANIRDSETLYTVQAQPGPVIDVLRLTSHAFTGATSPSQNQRCNEAARSITYTRGEPGDTTTFTSSPVFTPETGDLDDVVAATHDIKLHDASLDYKALKAITDTELQVGYDPRS